MVLLRTVHLKGSLGNQKGPSMALLRKKTPFGTFIFMSERFWIFLHCLKETPDLFMIILQKLQ